MAKHSRLTRIPYTPLRRRMIAGLVCGGALTAAALSSPATTTLVAGGSDKPSTVTVADRSSTADRASRDQARTESAPANSAATLSDAPASPTQPAAPAAPATPAAPAPAAPAPAPAPTMPSTVVDLDKAQTANAIAIVKTGRDMGVSERGRIIAVATSLQESQLYNLDVAVDHDSLGLFQQRPSSGWGTPQQLIDPAYASRAFYTGLLQDKSDWGCLTCAAQRVQVSAYPDAYAKHEAHATAIVQAIDSVLGS